MKHTVTRPTVGSARLGGVLAVCATLTVAACGGNASTPDGSNDLDSVNAFDAPLSPDAFVDQSGPLYDPNRVLQVEVTLAPDDWDLIRYQRRNLIDIFGGANCFSEPFESPFTYVKGSVTIDGEVVADVGVRKKGFIGSIDEDRPSLKIQFDEYMPGRRYLTEKNLTLNNNRQDGSAIRQCITFGLFRQAGITTPRCNFARVSVNGEDLGIYTHVETVDKQFLRRNFAGDQALGDLLEGTLSDFVPGWSGTYEQDTNDSAPSTIVSDIAAAVALPDDQFVAALGAVIDLPGFIRFWAMESLVRHWDGYAGNQNNHYVYRAAPGAKVVFFPWGVDQTFSRDATIGSVYLQGALTRRLYRDATTRAMYNAELTRIMTDVFDEVAVEAEANRMRALLATFPDPNGTRNNAINAMLTNMKARRAAIMPELTGATAVPIPAAEVRAPICFAVKGSITGNFAITWGTLGADPFVATSTSQTWRFNGTNQTMLRQGGTAGTEPGARATINLIGEVSATSIWVAQIQTTPDRLVPGTLSLNGVEHQGVLARLNPTTGAVAVLGYLSGTVTLTQGAASNGTLVAGSVDAVIEAR